MIKRALTSGDIDDPDRGLSAGQSTKKSCKANERLELKVYLVYQIGLGSIN